MRETPVAEKRTPMTAETWQARHRKQFQRQWVILGAYLVASVVATMVMARTGADPNLMFGIFTGVVALSGVYAWVSAWRTADSPRLSDIETRHLLVWVDTVTVSVVCLIVWMVLDDQPSVIWVWAMTGAGVLGAIAARARQAGLRPRS